MPTDASETGNQQDDEDEDAWGGWSGYWCEWCGSYQFVPSPEADGVSNVHPALTPGQPLTTGRRWVCIRCGTKDDPSWTDEWTERKAAIRRVR